MSDTSKGASEGMASNASILQRVDAQREQYMRITGAEPKYLYVCQEYAHAVDEALGMVAFTYNGMHLVIVSKRDWLGVGDRYAEEAV